MENSLDHYTYRREFMKTGDFLVWKSNSMIGWLIQKFTRSNVNHVGMVIRFAQFDSVRVFTLEALEHGIVLRALSDRLRNHKGQCWWHPLHLDFQDKRFAMGMVALSLVGTKYDYGSIFKQTLGRVSAEATRLFCSEYGQIIATRAGVMKKTRTALQPRDYPFLKWLSHGRTLI